MSLTSRLTNGVFDIGEMTGQLESSDTSYENFVPADEAMRYLPYRKDQQPFSPYPYVHAIICRKRYVPWIVTLIAPILGTSQWLRFIHLDGCSTSDHKRDNWRLLGEALQKNKRANITYYNFANNPKIGKNADPFFNGLRAVTADIIYLSFARCGIEECRTVLDALQSNPHLARIGYLYSNGNDCSSARLFKEYLDKRMATPDYPILHLGFGGNEGVQEEILRHLIDKDLGTIEELSLAGNSNCSKKVAMILGEYLKKNSTVRVLDLSYCDMNPEHT
jgi:hypothetical protein